MFMFFFLKNESIWDYSAAMRHTKQTRKKTGCLGCSQVGVSKFGLKTTSTTADCTRWKKRVKSNEHPSSGKTLMNFEILDLN